MEFYKVIVAPKVFKDLKPFPKDVAQTIWQQIRGLQETQRPPNCKKLKGACQEEYRLRVKGVYRVLYKIFDREKTVYVSRVLHRKDAYR